MWATCRSSHLPLLFTVHFRSSCCYGYQTQTPPSTITSSLPSGEWVMRSSRHRSMLCTGRCSRRTRKRPSPTTVCGSPWASSCATCTRASSGPRSNSTSLSLSSSLAWWDTPLWKSRSVGSSQTRQKLPLQKSHKVQTPSLCHQAPASQPTDRPSPTPSSVLFVSRMSLFWYYLSPKKPENLRNTPQIITSALTVSGGAIVLTVAKPDQWW
eukprot:GHVL01018339.1.p1 GENE.GHVL01018339.1~~GHVL01018339.1.p1  ORF type:complete len:211 (+),score=-2.76 GHVL01018339.1:138-770(+)